jgi:hypothetical protein
VQTRKRGALIALFDGSDQFHERAVSFLRGVTGSLVTNLPIIAGVVYMLDFPGQKPVLRVRRR